MNLRNTRLASPSPFLALWQRWRAAIIGVVALSLLVFLIARLLLDTASSKRQVVDTPMVMLPPPPAPPPPVPEKPPEPEPEKLEPEVVEPKPTPIEPLEPPKDDTPPSPSKDLGDPVTIDGPAQAGTDAFGIGAGRGGGSTGGAGGGLGAGSYSRYVANALQQGLARDPQTRLLAFDDIQVDLWLGPDGRIARALLVKSSGSAPTDEAVLSVMRAIDRIQERPPASLRFPLRVSMRGRRP